MRERIKYYYVITVRFIIFLMAATFAGILCYFGIVEGFQTEYISGLVLIGAMVIYGQLLFRYLITSIVKIIILEDKIVLVDLSQKQSEISKQEILSVEEKILGYEIRTKSGKKYHTYGGAGKVYVVRNGIEHEGIRSTDFY